MTRETDDAGIRRSRSAAATRGSVVACALALIAIVPLLPVLFAPGFPAHYEGFRYEVLTSLFMDGMAHGQPYPRWLPAFSGGRGYPTFVFYQPLLFFMTAGLRTIGAPLVTLTNATYVADYLALLVGVTGAYRLARSWLPTDRATSLGLALFFALTPYIFTNIHVRGDHSELVSMMFTPWPLVALRMIERRLTDGGPPRVLLPVLVGAAGLSGIVLGHPAPALVYGMTISLLAGVRTLTLDDRERRRRWLIACGAMAALALLASSPYWYVLLQCRGFARLDRATSGEFSPVRHLLSPLEVLFDRAAPPSVADLRADRLVPVGLGVAHVALTFAGAAIALRAGPRRAPWGVGCAIAFAAMIAAIAPWAAPIWSRPTPLMMLQFPFRILSVTTLVMFACAAHAIAAIDARTLRLSIVAGACLVTIVWHAPMFHASPLMSAPLPGAPSRPITWGDARLLIEGELRDIPLRNADYELIHEFDPIWHTTVGDLRGDGPLFVGNADVHAGADVYRPTAQVRAPRATAVVLRQLYFPGWHVEVNGIAIGDDDLRANLRPDGQMIIGVPAGTSAIVAWYDGPPGWRARVAATWIGIGIVLAVLLRAQRRWSTITPAERRSPGTTPAL